MWGWLVPMSISRFIISFIYFLYLTNLTSRKRVKREV